MTFWFLLCTEQSRSQRLTTSPWVSANTCTSTCLGWTMYFSIKTISFPNPFKASRFADVSPSKNSEEEWTVRMPLPPPP